MASTSARPAWMTAAAIADALRHPHARAELLRRAHDVAYCEGNDTDEKDKALQNAFFWETVMAADGPTLTMDDINDMIMCVGLPPSYMLHLAVYARNEPARQLLVTASHLQQRMRRYVEGLRTHTAPVHTHTLRMLRLATRYVPELHATRWNYAPCWPSQWTHVVRFRAQLAGSGRLVEQVEQMTPTEALHWVSLRWRPMRGSGLQHVSIEQERGADCCSMETVKQYMQRPADVNGIDIAAWLAHRRAAGQRQHSGAKRERSQQDPHCTTDVPDDTLQDIGR